MMVTTPRQAAPGDLEHVRRLLNTWVIPNDSRVAEDHFDEFAAELGVSGDESVSLRALRDDLRHVVEGISESDAHLTSWIDALGLRPVVRDCRVTYEHRSGAPGDALVAVLAAINDGTWSRLKACPDCRWVFYDHTRNGSKRWCLMNADGAGGRGCGTIAKVKRHRARQQ